jgi:hypothetical protein
MKKRNRLVGKDSNGEAGVSCGPRMKAVGLFHPQPSLATYVPLPLEDAMRAKSAELWLRLGEPLEALAELENMSPGRRRNSWVHLLQAAATRAARSFGAAGRL